MTFGIRSISKINYLCSVTVRWHTVMLWSKCCHFSASNDSQVNNLKYSRNTRNRLLACISLMDLPIKVVAYLYTSAEVWGHIHNCHSPWILHDLIPSCALLSGSWVPLWTQEEGWGRLTNTLSYIIWSLFYMIHFWLHNE